MCILSLYSRKHIITETARLEAVGFIRGLLCELPSDLVCVEEGAVMMIHVVDAA